MIDWNRTLISTLTAPNAQPASVHPTRSFAMVQAAEYNAVVSITHAGRPYRSAVPAAPDARPDAAADQAAHDVMLELYPSMRTTFDSQLARQLAGLPAGSATYDAWRWVGRACSNNADQLRPAAPPSVNTSGYTDALTEVKSIGQDSSTTRTPDQTVAAKFWSAAPIWNTWNQIADQFIGDQHATLTQASSVLSTMDLAMADTTSALYDAKYHRPLWRPVTAIDRGIPAAHPPCLRIPTWKPLTPTAADPSYPGACKMRDVSRSSISGSGESRPVIARLWSAMEAGAAVAVPADRVGRCLGEVAEEAAYFCCGAGVVG